MSEEAVRLSGNAGPLGLEGGGMNQVAGEAFEMYGRIKEGVHVAGYSFERACGNLEWLLDENRWKLGGRFGNVNDFLDSIKLDQFRIVTEQRQRIARRIKELQPAASQRAIARVVGVAKSTIDRDLGTPFGPNGPPATEMPNGHGHDARPLGPNGPPVSVDLGGAAVAKLADDTAHKAAKSVAKREERLGKLAEISNANAVLPVTERKYAAIYADPPWTYEVWSGAGKDRAAENHYPTMDLESIKALPVGDTAADDCALFLWAVMPQLPDALEVIKAWGFEFKTCAFVWVKTTLDGSRPATGMGYWTRANAELCLLATRGTPPRLNADVHQVVQSPRAEHSKKPDEVAARIERLVPGPYIELFARGARPGWDVWGNQAEAA